FAPDVERADDLSVLVRCAAERALQGRRRGVVDRADETGDVARGRRLLAPVGEAAPRLALEIDDEHVVLRGQDLAEMEVAVMPDLAARNRLGQELAEASFEVGGGSE